jgi:serine phosphatase RsbU (regulator of sigma subunit)
MTAFTYTADFHQEFEAETARLLRRRFIWFAAVAGVLTILEIARQIPEILQLLTRSTAEADEPLRRLAVRYAGLNLGHDVLTLLLYGGVLLYVRTVGPPRHLLLRLSMLCILLDGVLDIGTASIMGSAGWGIIFVVVAHSLAAAFLPWSPQQAIMPMAPLLILNAATWLLVWRPDTARTTETIVFPIAAMLMTPLAAAPGTLITYLKHARRMEQFKLRFLQDRYGMIRRELVDARRIHEALFPAPVREGPLRFDYRYEPMLQIGGDYLYAKFSPAVGGEPPAFNLILIDVTGHGIAAALTVNRLYGEVERLFAESPHARPGDILRALNRYVHLTLANHSVYVTALCVRVETGRNLLEYASGGHPPAFLRAVDGTIEELGSTSIVLGACPDRDFDPEPQQRQFGPGDTLIAYTDGAIEARNDAGRQLGVSGLLRVLACGKPDPAGVSVGVGGWITTILRAVEGHRMGPPRDDTIVVEITRPLPAAPPPTRIAELREPEPVPEAAPA